MKTVDVHLHDADPARPVHVMRSGADLIFDHPVAQGLALAGITFRPYAAGWLRLAARHHDYTAELIETEDRILIVHLRPVVEPAKSAPEAGSVPVSVPSVEWWPAEVGEA